MRRLWLYCALCAAHAAASDRVEVREYKGQARAAAVADMTVPTVVLSFFTIVAFVAVGTAPRVVGRAPPPMVGPVWAGVVFALTGAIFANVELLPATALSVLVVGAATATVMTTITSSSAVTARAALLASAATAGAAGGAALDAGAPVAAVTSLPALLVVAMYALKANTDKV